MWRDMKSGSSMILSDGAAAAKPVQCTYYHRRISGDKSLCILTTETELDKTYVVYIQCRCRYCSNQLGSDRRYQRTRNVWRIRDRSSTYDSSHIDVRSFSLNNQNTATVYSIQSQWTTNRKWHVYCRIVPLPMTLSELHRSFQLL